MPDCKECMHYYVCANLWGYETEHCESFKDKSLHIELPCKVGDTIYHTFTGKVDYFEVYDIQVHNDGIYVTYDFNRYFNADEFGKTVFLTREEAEKKLKEWEDD